VATKKASAVRPRVGDSCWFVEWCLEHGLVDPAHPEYGSDPDKDVTRCRRVETREEAERLATEVYPIDASGFVRYWPAEFVAYDEADAHRHPHAGFWQAAGDEEHYEGEA
jgi:hypothetical protein